MDVRRLRFLLELSRLGSMHEVAAELGVTTSTVSQQIAALAVDVGTPLLEPVGRRVRLTPAGHRLADHAVTILAAVEAARVALDPDAEPVGTLRVAGFATGIRRALLPVVGGLAATHPGLHVRMSEYEPREALDLLARDEIDLALTYDYTLAPAAFRDDLVVRPLWTTPWGLGVPRADRSTDLSAYAARDWIVNSRNTADDEALRTLGSLAGFAPRITHWIDSLDLVADLIAAGHGVGLLPLDAEVGRGVRVLPLTDPDVTLRAYAVTRRGREAWPPLHLVVDRLSVSLAAPG